MNTKWNSITSGEATVYIKPVLDIDEIKSRINPAYADMLGTESYERKLLCDEIEALRKEVESLQSALMNSGLIIESLRRDAERYRWLRTQGTEFLQDWADQTPEEGDAAIDAAMAKEE